MTYSLPKLFPHFHRVISSRVIFSLEMTFLWICLIALFVINILAVQTQIPLYWKPLMELFKDPFSVSRHIDLASLLWQQGKNEQARNLMMTAQSLSKAGQPAANGGGTINVLGLTTSPMDILSQWEHEVDKLKDRYIFWQSVAIAKPDYRDAFVTLASLAYQLGKLDESKRWLSKAQALDPNDPTIKKISPFIQGK